VFDVRLLARRSISYRNNSGYDLTIDHLPANRRYSVERCRISAENDFASVGTTIYTTAPIRLQNELPPPGIELVTLRALDEAPVDAATQRPEGTATPPIQAQTPVSPDHCSASIAAAFVK
jgi:hypothetical protein